MSGGQIALKELGLPIHKYFSYEIKPTAIQTTQLNFPDTIQLGDVRNFNINDLQNETIDLFLCGSPCQNMSLINITGKVGVDGDKSSLIYICADIFKQVKPKYFLFENVLGVNYLISNVIAWFFSVLFAYITNRIWVFESKSPDILKEMSLFFGGRIFSGVIDTALMYLFIDVMTIGDDISKIIVQVIVIILNYIFSKLIVFKD